MPLLLVTDCPPGSDLAPCAVYIYDDLSVMEKRLFERYLAESVSDEAVRKYKSRTEQNVYDYSRLDGYAELFYAFLKNGSSPMESAEALSRIFDSFSSGVGKNGKENMRVVMALKESASKKQ